MSLYEECIGKLGKEALILSEVETIQLFDSLQDCFPFTFYGRIDWSQVKAKQKFDLLVENAVDVRAYILWDNALFPAIESKLSNILENIDYIKRVSFDTWIYAPEEFVIEFYHEGEIMIGYSE
ncbi:CDI toxin immunity protein [Paenibacillus sp. IITD108]|uniref:CDI toxin immunity protein n=1 Tax=Paenibacillus sp. IITD108 TaxID=3116649 RepID=UPI002F428E33